MTNFIDIEMGQKKKLLASHFPPQKKRLSLGVKLGYAEDKTL